MLYKVEFSEEAQEQLEDLYYAGTLILAKKIRRISYLLSKNPRRPGIGKPERLRYKEIETWSIRIDDRHRMIYEIDNMEVTVISVLGHYGDK